MLSTIKPIIKQKPEPGFSPKPARHTKRVIVADDSPSPSPDALPRAPSPIGRRRQKYLR